MAKILEVDNLSVSFHTYAGEVKAVRDISFDMEQGETLAVVGESGCGKTVAAKSLMRLIPQPPGEIKPGSSILFNGEDVTKMNRDRLRRLRGEDMSMIFQDPMTSLNPTMTIADHVVESIVTHRKMNRKDAFDQAIEMLELVNIPKARERAREYPHQFSGGMRQRVMIAVALACRPSILIADEPTTALDVTIQAQILDLIKELQNKLNMSVMLITHNLGIVATAADRIQVMYAGKIIERGLKREIFYNCEHPYTWALLKSVPRLHREGKTELYSLKGTPPDLLKPPKGCPFATRCDYCMPICLEEMPPETELTSTHSVYCWLQHPSAPRISKPDLTGGASDNG